MRIALVAVALAGCGDKTTSETAGIPTGTTGIETGECEGSALRGALPEAPTEVSAGVDPEGRLVVSLDNLMANCCPSPRGDFTVAGSGVTLAFVDVTDESPCDCTCVTDFVVTSAPFEPGTYTLEVSFNGAALGSVEVTVP